MEESIMVMENSRPSLESLIKLAPELNKATDLYMAELKEIEAQLDKLNLGIAVELEGSIKHENTKARYDENGVGIGQFETYWSLGYGKDERGHWGFFVRQYSVDGIYPNQSDPLEEQEVPLLQASRDLRIAAADRIPELLQRLESEVTKKIESLARVSDKR